MRMSDLHMHRIRTGVGVHHLLPRQGLLLTEVMWNRIFRLDHYQTKKGANK